MVDIPLDGLVPIMYGLAGLGVVLLMSVAYVIYSVVTRRPPPEE